MGWCSGPWLIVNNLIYKKIIMAPGILLGQRLKEVRAVLGLKQVEICSISGIPLSTYRKYEIELALPGAEAIAGLIRAGINANWLLTGQGSMHLNDQSVPPESLRLARAIQSVEERLAALGATIPLQKRVHLILLVYDLLGEDGELKPERVNSLVELAV